MRDITGDALAQIMTQNGTEPICIVGVTWWVGGPEYLYADRSTGTIAAKVLQVGNVEDVVDLTGSTNATNITVILDDTDGTIKTIFNNNDIHKRPCTIYQTFAAIDPSNKFVLFEGYIESPIVWGEGDRQLSFAVVSLYEHVEIGFAPEEGQFPNLPTADVNVPWPLGFGTSLHYPGLTYQPIPIGTTLNPFYYVNSNLDVIDPATTYAYQLANRTISFSAQPIYFSGDQPTDTNDDLTNALNASINALASELDSRPPPGTITFMVNNQEYDAHDYDLVKTIPPLPILPLPQSNQSAYADIPEVQEELKAKNASNVGVHLLNNGYGFPVGVNLTLSMNNHVFTGKMNSSGFMTLTELILPTATLAYSPFVYGPPDNSLEGKFQRQQAATYFTPDGSFTPAQYNAMNPGFNSVGEAPVGYKLTQGLVSDGFQLFDAGSTITVLGDLSIDYIVNIVPTTVTQVYGYRAVGNVKTLTAVPASRWSQVSVDFNGVTAQIVRLKRPLPNYPGEGWDDGIYVDQESSVGPNPVDIIEYCVNTYTNDLTCDSTSFSLVRGYLANYPMNFVYAQKTDLITFISDIAYQCRCAVYVKNFVVYIRYLPEARVADDTITEADIIEGTLQVTTTESEQLITRLTGTYVGDYATGITDDIVVRSNITKYGLFRETHDFFAYTEPQYVLKTCTYWIIQKSNVWKRIKFSCPLSKLNIETFDTLALDFDTPYVASEVVNARVESCQYDSVGNKIDIECWVPVRLGEMTLYPFAYPQNVSATEFFPTYFADYQASVYQDFRQATQGTVSTVAGQQTGTSSIETVGGDGNGLGASGPLIGLPGYVNEDGDFIEGFDGSSQSPNQLRQVSDMGSQYPSDLADPVPTPRTRNLIPLIDPLNLPNNAVANNAGSISSPTPAFLQTPQGAMIPGKITLAITGTNQYLVDIYPNGTSNTATNVTVTCLAINPADTIPVGTWVSVNKITQARQATGNSGGSQSSTLTGTRGPTGTSNEVLNFSWNAEYYMLVPIWLA